MNDLQICGRIAEIEGLDFRVLHEGYSYEHVLINFQEAGGAYNPLTNDALCFRLMIKHSIEVKPPLNGVTNSKTKVVWSVFNGADDFDNYYLYDESTNKAICLAIIESHKEANND